VFNPASQRREAGIIHRLQCRGRKRTRRYAMELHELEPTGYFSEFSWISNEDEEEELPIDLNGVDIFAAPLPDPLQVADMSSLPVLEAQGAGPS
jgi:hypothetical protein